MKKTLKGTMEKRINQGKENVNISRLRRSKKLAAILILAMLTSATGCGILKPKVYGKSLKKLSRAVSEEVYNSSSNSSDNDYDLGNGQDVYPDPNASGDNNEPENYASEENAEFEEFLMEYFKDTVTEDTLNYNFTVKDGSKYGIKSPKATLGDASMDSDAIEKEKKEDEEFYEKLTKFEDAELTESERFTYECMKLDAEVGLHSYDNIYLFEPFSPMRGLQANLPTNFTDYPFDDKSDVEDYVTLLGQVKDYFDKVLEFEYEKSEKGYFMSDDVADKVIEQCDEFTAEKEDNFMISVFNDRVDDLDFLTDKEKEEYKKRDKEAVLNSVIPAFEDVRKTIQELKGTGKNNMGICNYENGKEYYENFVFPRFAGSCRSVESAIQLMDARKQNLVIQLSAIYTSNPDAYEYYTKNNGKIFSSYDNMEASELIDYLVENCMDEYPKLDSIPYKANYLDKHMEKIMENTLAYYMSPAIDDKENNIIYVNGAHKDGMWVTLAHEGCPGHMYQNTYFQSTNPKPACAMQHNLGYMEGWAVYSSYNTLSKCDFGGVEYAPQLAEIHKINEDLGYMLYGRIDMGVNYEGWTYDDVSDYLSESGYSADITDSVITTVIGDPGVYLSYSMGYYEMEALRQKAEEELGSKFDPVEFHKVILEAGPCMFENLNKKVDKYIEENK